MSYAQVKGSKNDFLSVYEKDINVQSGELEATHHYFREESQTSDDLEESTEFTASDGKKAGTHEIKLADKLVILEKKPVESYFEGLKTKRINKKKYKEPKKRFLDLQSCPAVQNEGWIPTLAGASPKPSQPCEAECMFQNRRMLAKIRGYEATREHRRHNISMKQRLAEEEYLEQQENLVETWMGVLQRHRRLRNPDSRKVSPCRRSLSNKAFNIIDVSRRSKRFWSGGEEPQPKKDEENKKNIAPPRRKSILDDLDQDFGEKLVIVDVKDESQ